MVTENQIDKALGDVTVVSPYRLSQIASDLTGKFVRAQVVYNYVRQMPQLIKATKNDLGKWEVTRDDAKAWLMKYGPKHQVPQAERTTQPA